MGALTLVIESYPLPTDKDDREKQRATIAALLYDKVRAWAHSLLPPGSGA